MRVKRPDATELQDEFNKHMQSRQMEKPTRAMCLDLFREGVEYALRYQEAVPIGRGAHDDGDIDELDDDDLGDSDTDDEGLF